MMIRFLCIQNSNDIKIFTKTATLSIDIAREISIQLSSIQYDSDNLTALMNDYQNMLESIKRKSAEEPLSDDIVQIRLNILKAYQ